MLQELGFLTEAFSGNIQRYALLLAAVSTITVALLELVKGLLFARLLFHKWRLKKWISDQGAYVQMVDLAIGGRLQRALFNQRTDRMISSIQSAASVAIENPVLYPHFFEFLTDRSVEDLKHSGEITSDQLDSECRLRFLKLVTRRVEAFRLETEYSWARLNQLAAVTAAGVLLYCLLNGLQDKPEFLFRLTLSLFGGIMAPFAKDVVAALTGLRARLGPKL